MNIDETEKLLTEMRGEIDSLRAHLEAAARAGSMLQQQYLSGEIGNMTSAMAQLETHTKGSEAMTDIRRKSTAQSKTTAFGFAGDPMDIKKQVGPQGRAGQGRVGRRVGYVGLGRVYGRVRGWPSG